MMLTMINTHNAFKALQQAGVADNQAEVMVEIFAGMQQENALTKGHLSQAMEGLVRTQNGTNSVLNKLDGRFTRFESDVKVTLQAIDQRFDKLEVRFTQFENDAGVKFQAIDQRFDKLEERFTQFENDAGVKFQAINQRFDKFEIRFNQFENDVNMKFQAIDQRFDRIDQRFEKIDQRFEKVENRLLDIDQNLASLKRDSHWIKALMMAMACAMVTGTLKYIFTS